MIDERKNIQTTLTHYYGKHNGPLPYYYPNKEDPWHLKLLSIIARFDHPSTNK